MKINKRKIEIACARSCVNLSDVAKTSGISRSTINSCIRQAGSTATIGKIAKALGVDVLDIIEQEE